MTRSKHSEDFKVNAPNKVFVADITYVRTANGWLYLAIILDLFFQMVVSWFSSFRISKELVMEALQGLSRQEDRKRDGLSTLIADRNMRAMNIGLY